MNAVASSRPSPRPHRRTGRVLACAALAGLGVLPSFSAEQSPGETELSHEQLAVEFMKLSTANYRQELDAMNAEYASRGKEDLPSLGELFLSGTGLRRSHTLTVAVSRMARARQIEDLGKPETDDNKCRFYLTSVRFQGGVDDPDAPPRRRLSADKLTAEALDLHLGERLVISGKWVAVTEKLYTVPVTIPGHEPSTRKLWGDTLVSGLSGSHTDIRCRFSESVHLSISGGLYLANPRLVAGKTPGRASVTLKASNLFEGMDEGKKDMHGNWTRMPKAKIAAEKKFGTRTYQVYRVEQAGLFGEDEGFEYAKIPAVLLRTSESGKKEPLLAPAPMAVYFARANPAVRTHTAIGRVLGIVVTDGKKTEVRGLRSSSLARPVVVSGRTFDLRPAANAHYVGGEGTTTFYVKVGTPAHGRVLQTRRYKLTAAALSMTITPEPRDGCQLIAGQKYTVQLSKWQGAPKGEEMRVHWKELSLPGGVQVGGSWGSTTRSFVSRLAFAHDALGAWKAADFKLQRPVRRVRFRPSAELLLRDNRRLPIECPRKLELFRPGLTRVQLFARRPGEEWQKAPAQIDLFTSSTGARGEVEFSANLTFADGSVVKHVAPGSLGWAHLRMSGAFRLFQEVTGSEWTRYTVNLAPMTGAEATFSLYVNPLAASKGVLLENPNSPPTAPPVRVTLNRLMLTSETIPDRQMVRHRLMALGPGKMSNCHATWSTRSSDGARTRGVGTGFVRSGAGQAVATLDSPLVRGASAWSLTHVTVLDSSGNVLAVLKGGAQVEAKLQMRLDFPRTATGDQKLIVRALIDGLPLDLAKRSHCRWSVTPAVGAFASARTPIAVSNLGRAVSIAVLEFDPSKTQVGMKPKIAADLVLGD